MVSKFHQLIETASLVSVDNDNRLGVTYERYSDGTSIERWKNGAFCYYDKNQQFHREGGPAVLSIEGQRKSETWYIHGDEHRTDGPSYINYHEKVVMYSIRGHRVKRSEYLKHFDDDTEFKDWTVYGGWWRGNESISESDIDVPRGYKEEDEIGIYFYDGNNDYHRVGRPAIVYHDGSESWWIHGKRHRINGPAFIDVKSKEVGYCVNGKHLSREDYLKHFEDETEYKDWRESTLFSDFQ